MSFWSHIDSFFSKIDADIAKIFGKAQAWEPRVASTLSVLAPLLAGILGTVAGAPVAALVNKVVMQALADLGAVSAVVNEAGGTQATALTLLNSVQSNLAALLQAAEVKNSGLAAKVTNDVNLIVNEINAIVASAK